MVAQSVKRRSVKRNSTSIGCKVHHLNTFLWVLFTHTFITPDIETHNFRQFADELSKHRHTYIDCSLCFKVYDKRNRQTYLPFFAHVVPRQVGPQGTLKVLNGPVNSAKFTVSPPNDESAHYKRLIDYPNCCCDVW